MGAGASSQAVMCQLPRVLFVFFVGSSVLLVTSELLPPECCKIGEPLHPLVGTLVSHCTPEEGEAPNAPNCSLSSDGNLILENVSYNFTWDDLKCNTYMFDTLHHIPKNGSVHRDAYSTNTVLCLENKRNRTSGEHKKSQRSFSAIFDVPLGDTYRLYAIGFFISVPFSLATLLTYALVKELESLHGSIIVRYMLCHVISYITIALVDLNVITNAMGYLCTTAGYAVQYFAISTFFWLNVMCYNIYRAFRDVKHLETRLNEKISRTLFMYSSYAFFTPLVILMMTVFMDQYPGIPKHSILKPGMGIGKCFFKEKEAKWIYFYSPIAMIIISDICMFLATAYLIASIKKQCRVANALDSKMHNATDNQERFSLYIKLMKIMGIRSVLDLFSSDFYDSSVLWYTLDFANALEGVFFFSILVWNKRVKKILWLKLCNRFGRITISSQKK